MLMHPIVPTLEGSVLDAPEFDCAGDTNRNLFQLAVELTAARATASSATAGPSRMGRSPAAHAQVLLRPPVRGVGMGGGDGIYVDEAVREKLAEITSGISKIRYGSEYFGSARSRPRPRAW